VMAPGLRRELERMKPGRPRSRGMERPARPAGGLKVERLRRSRKGPAEPAPEQVRPAGRPCADPTMPEDN